MAFWDHERFEEHEMVSNTFDWLTGEKYSNNSTFFWKEIFKRFLGVCN